MQEYVSLSIFDREKYDSLEIQSYGVTCIGEIHLSDEEQSILTMHPKLSVMDTLHEAALEFEQVLAYAKLRIQLHQELGEKLNDAEEIEMTQEEQELVE